MKTSRGGAASVVSGFCLNGNWGRMRRFDGCVQTNWLLLSEVVPSTRSLLCQFRYCSSPSILCFFSSLSWWFWCPADVLLIVGSCSLPMEMRSVLTKLIYIVHNFLIPGPIPGVDGWHSVFLLYNSEMGMISEEDEPKSDCLERQFS